MSPPCAASLADRRRRTRDSKTARRSSRSRSTSRPSPSAARRRRSTCPRTKAGSTGRPTSSSPACTAASTLESEVRTGAAGGDPRRRRHAARRRPGDRTRTPAGRARRSTSPAKSANPPKKKSRSWRQRGFPPETPVGISGLEKAFNRRLAGQAGRQAAGRRRRELGDQPRVLAESASRHRGPPVKTTIDPEMQETAVAALAGRAGGVAVLDAQERRRPRARRARPYSAPQPPGSTFKIITTIAALEKHVVTLDDEFELRRRHQRRRPLHRKRERRDLRRHLPRSLRRVLQRRLPPPRPEDRQRRSWSKPRKSSASTRRRPSTRRRSSGSRTGRIDDPDRNRRRSRPRASRRSARAKCWRRRWRWQASPRRSPTAACGCRPRSSTRRSCGPTMKPVRVMSKKIAGELTELMVGVVERRDRLRRRDRRRPRSPPRPAPPNSARWSNPKKAPETEEEEHPEHDKDAWFSAFATVEKPQAGDRRAADRSRSGGRRSRGPGRLRGPQRRLQVAARSRHSPATDI